MAAIVIVHGAVLALGEPLINTESWQHDISRMSLGAIRAVLSFLYDITATSYDLSLLPTTVTFIWVLCIKSLSRFVHAATQVGDAVSVTVFKSEIDVFRLALQQYSERHPVAARCLKLCDDGLKAQDMMGGLTDVRLFDCAPEDLIAPEWRPGGIPSISSSNTLNTPSASVETGSTSGWSGPTPRSSTGARTSLTGPDANTASKNASPDIKFDSQGMDVVTDLNMRFDTGAVAEGSAAALEGSASALGTEGGNGFGWFDISSFSFDADQLRQVAEMFGASGAVFDGSSMGLNNMGT